MKEYIQIIKQLNAISDSEFEGLLKRDSKFEVNTDISFVTLSYSVRNGMYIVRSLRWDKFGKKTSLLARILLTRALANKVCRVNVQIRNRCGGCYEVFNPVSIKKEPI